MFLSPAPSNLQFTKSQSTVSPTISKKANLSNCERCRLSIVPHPPKTFATVDGPRTNSIRRGVPQRLLRILPRMRRHSWSPARTPRKGSTRSLQVRHVRERGDRRAFLTFQHLRCALCDYIADLLARTQRGEVEHAYERMISDLEPELFAQAIKLAQGNQAKAARWLGVTRLKMREKLAELGLHPSQM